MRIAIIGAGVAGVCSAYELAAAGHQVTVFERRGSVAAEGSFATGGHIAPALALPWLAPSFPRPGAGPLGWQWQRWRSQRKPATQEAQDRVLHLARFSHERLQQLRRHLQLDHERAEGQLVLLRQDKDQKAIQFGLERLQRLDMPYRVLDAAQCLALEPGLNPEIALHGGIQLGLGEVGNTRQFCHLLRSEAQRLGARFRFHTTVQRLEAGSPARLVHEYTPTDEQLGPSTHQLRRTEAPDAGDTQPAPPGPQEERFDAVLVCAGTGAAPLLKALGLKPRWRELHTQSITAPLRVLEAHPHLGPVAGLLDWQRQVGISRIGQRVRIASLPSPIALELKASSLAPLHQALSDWFPGAMQGGQVQNWQGRHLALDDGLPLLGASGQTGIWLNIAQQSLAHSGWTLACGVAAVLARQIGGGTAAQGARDPTLPDIGGLDIGRWA